MELTPEQRHRYARHLLLPEIGARGQARFLTGAVRVVGVGAAAEEAATYLVAAGVGRIWLEAELAERIGNELRRLNPDSSVGADPGKRAGAWHAADVLDVVLVAPDEPERRAAGASAALGALMTLAGIAT